ncbi:hypothetical protein ACRABS_004436, partial [Salmonella enterica subsp. enterica]
MLNQWVTAQECVGVSCFPGHDVNIRRHLEKLVAIGTPNILGGSSIVLGDNDTGLKQNGDGLLDIYANGVQVFRFQNDTLESKKSINVTGRLTPTDYGNFDSRYVQDIRLGSLQYGQVWNGPGFSDTSGYV